MFRLRSIEIENFGPFKGRQHIDFPEDDGVVVFFGENMRGKTNLLNAIRFAFFGKFLGRGSRAIDLTKVCNIEAVAEGHFGFEVRLEFLYEKASYRLTRSFHPKAGILLPSSDEDYKIDVYIECDGVMLGPLETARQLERILPEQISRFFLFDGELLQEYEDLLLSESNTGAKIAESIERILGMPVLTGARTTLASVKDTAQREQATAAQGDQKTQQLGNALTRLIEEVRIAGNEQLEMTAKLANLRKQKGAIEESMRKGERSRTLLERRDERTRELKRLEEDVADARLASRASMGGAWAVVLDETMREALGRLRVRQRDLDADATRGRLLEEITAKHLETCPTCQQSIGQGARERLLHGQTAQTEDERKAVSSELEDASQKIAALERVLSSTSAEALKLRLDDLAKKEREVYSRKEELKEMASQLTDIDEDAVRQVKFDYESTIKQIKVLEDGLEASKKNLDDKAAQRDAIQAQLEKKSGTSAAAATARAFAQTASDLYDLMGQSIDVYREKLRHKVEANASAHFRELTTEPEYAGLRINDSYGLSIVHKDGQTVPLRSAGAEHVVALSLVAALQNNAPLRGPIIIDSPFVRLDSEHKARILKALPSLAGQVLMLVYEDEVSPTTAREVLAGELKKEMKLERVSARHTKIVEYT